MSFPTVVILQNISVFIFPLLLLNFRSRFGFIFRFRHFIQLIAVFFAIGAILSTINLPIDKDDFLTRALEVLPNYIYWSILIIFLVSHYRHIPYARLYGPIAGGLALTVVYVFMLQPAGILSLAIFKSISPNTFAFILIIFSPMTVFYVKKRYGFLAGFFTMIVLSLSGFLSESRSGSILTLLGSGLALYSENLFYNRRVVGIILTVVVSYFAGKTQIVKSAIEFLNPRVYELIYKTEDVLTKDGSYLVRVAMVEKAIAIFNKYPKYGIGLNNFTSFKTNIPGDFEGYKYVQHKVGKRSSLSAHNSYFGVLAEGGLFLFIPMVILIAYPILYFILRLNHIPNNKKPIFISIAVMAIHLYFIFAIVNVFAWFVIGLACALASFRVSEMRNSEPL